MGSGLSKKKKKQTQQEEQNQRNQNMEQYDDDVLGAARFALNRQKDDQSSSIELMISCVNLPKMDLLSDSDPMVIVYIKQENRFLEVGKTEVIVDNPNPTFNTSIPVAFQLGKQQMLQFVIFDVDEVQDKEHLDKHTKIGTLEITLHEIVTAKNGTVRRFIDTKTKRGKKAPEIIIRGIQKDIDNKKISFHIAGKNFSGKHELSLSISAPSGHQQHYATLKTCEYKQNNSKKGIEWQPFIILKSKLSDEKGNIKFEVFERNKNGQRVSVGEYETALSHILDQQSVKPLKINKNGLYQGELRILECKSVTKHTFLSYVKGGVDISLIIAMDFTNSNKDPSNPKSLHTLVDEDKNEYLKALGAIGDILQHYDSDELIPLYGFGAKLPPQYNVVSHCFSLNGDYFEPEIHGLENVIKTYKEAVKELRFHGPTVFSEVVKMAVDYARSEEESDEPKYFILLIITDGVISDLEATKEQIVFASQLPISIVIVGVGDENFESMDELDSDDQLLYAKNIDQRAERDIVQFVPYSQYKDNNEELTLQTLEEIPKQFLEYMTMHGIEPSEQSSQPMNQAELLEQKKKKAEQRTTPQFLVNIKKEFIEQLKALDFSYEEILKGGIATPDINLVIEMISEQKKHEKFMANKAQKMPSIEEQINTVPFKPRKNLIKVQTFNTHQRKEIETVKSQRKEENYRITQKLLENRDKTGLKKKINSVGQQYVTDSDKINMKVESNQVKQWHFEQRDQGEHFRQLTASKTPISSEENICLICHENKINTMFYACGHATICNKCIKSNGNSCLICKQPITRIIYTQ